MSKAGNVRQFVLEEVLRSADVNALTAELGAGPLIGHNETTGAREDFNVGDASSGTVGHVVVDVIQRSGGLVKIVNALGAVTKNINLEEWADFDASYIPQRLPGVISGEVNSGGKPNFLTPGGGTNATCTIEATSTNLTVCIGGIVSTITSDISVTGLTKVATYPDNEFTIMDSWLVNTTNIDKGATKLVGEWGMFFGRDAMSAEADIVATSYSTNPNHAMQPYIIGTTEIMFAQYDNPSTSSEFVTCKRGFAGTDRTQVANGTTGKLLVANHLFLGNDLTTVTVSLNYPLWSATAPSTTYASTDDFYYNTIENVWYRYNGSAWAAYQGIYLGVAICDHEGCKWAECVDFNLVWSDLLRCEEMTVTGDNQYMIKAPFEVSVAAKTIRFDEDIFVSFSGNMEGSEVANQWYYLYVNSSGEFIFSQVAPRKRDHKKGLYHPNNYWRCVSMVFNDASSNLLTTRHCINDGVIELTGGGGTELGLSFESLGSSSWPTTQTCIPPIAKRADVQFEFTMPNDLSNYADVRVREIKRNTMTSKELSNSIVYQISAGGAAYPVKLLYEKTLGVFNCGLCEMFAEDITITSANVLRVYMGF